MFPFFTLGLPFTWINVSFAVRLFCPTAIVILALTRKSKGKLNEVKEMVEDQYLVYMCYGVIQGGKEEDIIYKTAGKAYMDFRRRISFQGKVSAEQRYDITEKVKKLLVKELPLLLQADTQETFDEKHHVICQDIIRIYDSTGGQAYGIAQRWVNQTLLHLALIEDNLHMGYWKMKENRKYFHVPVEQYVLEAAASKRKNKFKHGLNLMTAPLKHDKGENYQMEWYSPGEIQPPEFWEYPEYMEFQKAVRKRLKDMSSHTYRDCLSWAVYAYMEVVQRRNV